MRIPCPLRPNPTAQNSRQQPENCGPRSKSRRAHIEFNVGAQTIQEAYQLWNFGGTEVHNPNVDPRTGNVCLGVWKRTNSVGTFKLAHRVWNYDASGTFLGSINLSETITLGQGGNTHTGTFTLDFYDPSGNFLFEVAGNVTGERISVE